MKRRIPAPLIPTALVLFMGYANCSGPGFSALNQVDDVNLASGAPLSEQNVGTIPQSGKITAYQDRQFRAVVPGSGNGATISGTSLPSWMSIDQTSGEIRGVPPTQGTVTDVRLRVTINGHQTDLGPYEIDVLGDPLKAQQWALENTGQLAFAALAGTAGHDMQMKDSVRAGYTGEGIRIAISDTGVQENHQALQANLLSGASRNYLLNFDTLGSWTGSSTPDLNNADDAHGTAVAGLAVESGWDGIGGRGVAPLAKFAGFLYIQAQSALSTRGHATSGLLDQFAGDFDVFNYSWGDPQCMLISYSDINYEKKLRHGVDNLRNGRGAVYVKASGNQFWEYLDSCYEGVPADAYVLGNANFSEEATTPYTIMVGAVNADGTVTSYSTPGSNTWISAPGGETGYNRPTKTSVIAQKPAIVTTDFSGCGKGIKSFSQGQSDFDSGQDPNTACEHTATMNGTSSSSPLVAGAIALILQANPNLTWREIKHILAVTADKVDASRGPANHPSTGFDLAGHTYERGWTTNAAGFPFHNWYGFGRINVDKAVTMAKAGGLGWGAFEQTNVGSVWTHDSGNINVTVPGGNATGVSRTLQVTKDLTVEAVQVRITATSCIGHLGLEVVSPSGTVSTLMNINSFLTENKINSHIFLTNAFYGEKSAGTWTLRAIGAKTGCASTLNSWQLNVFGRR